MPNTPGELCLSDQEKRSLLQAARETIRASLDKDTPDIPPVPPSLRRKCGAFVTLHKRGALRGCIGYIEAHQPLIDAVRSAALAAAFSDPRFPPVRRQELDGLQIEISVLSPLRPLRDVQEIEVGRHGILIRQGYRSGLLLPQVATEYGWDRDTFLDQTCRKAGLPAGGWRSADTEIEIFSAQVFGEQER